MTYLAIAGDNKDIVCQVVDTFSKLGYKRNRLFAVGEIAGLGSSNYLVVTAAKAKDLVSRGIIVCTDNIENVKCYIPEPFGSTKYVEYATLNQIEKLKEKYGEQVKSVYIGEQCNISDYDLVIGATNVYSNMHKIVQLVSSK